MKLVRVTAPHFVVGFVVKDGRVCECAPILRRILAGRTVAEAAKALAAKRYKIEIVS